MAKISLIEAACTEVASFTILETIVALLILDSLKAFDSNFIPSEKYIDY